MIGSGIYVMVGIIVTSIAGPSIVLSFIIAGFVSMLSALCYAEFGTKVPKAGSAYVYIYNTIGEFWAFIIGWNIVLEHLLGAAAVARAWSAYIDNLSGNFISNLTLTVFGEWHQQYLTKQPDFLALLICLVYAFALGLGVKATATINTVLTIINISVMSFVIFCGFSYADFSNWNIEGFGFFPFGFAGVLTGAATCFYAFVGFDSIATSSEEAKSPKTSIPLATILSLGTVTVIYVLVSAALTLMVPFSKINKDAALPDAFDYIDLQWAKYIVSIGALCGMTTTILGTLFALPRCLYAMASDGLIFSCFAKINNITQVPTFNLAIAGIGSGILALVLDLEKLVEFISIGTLLAYTIVSAAILVLRYHPENDGDGERNNKTILETSESDEDDSTSHSSAEITSTGDMIQLTLAGRLKQQFKFLAPFIGKCRPGQACTVATFVFVFFSMVLCFHFKISSDKLFNGTWWAISLYGFLIFSLIACIIVLVAHNQNLDTQSFQVPFVPFIPILSILCNVELMVNLSSHTWLRFFIWLGLGILMYFFYGIHHSSEGELGSSYSMLTSSSEAVRGPWNSSSAGATITFKKIVGKVRNSHDRRRSMDIVDDED